jgi:hypothetical protein
VTEFVESRENFVKRIGERINDSLYATMFKFAPIGLKVQTWEQGGELVDTHPFKGTIEFKTEDGNIISSPARLVVDKQDIPPYPY